MAAKDRKDGGICYGRGKSQNIILPGGYWWMIFIYSLAEPWKGLGNVKDFPNRNLLLCLSLYFPLCLVYFGPLIFF